MSKGVWFVPTFLFEKLATMSTVGSPTGPEVHYTRTILFAAEVALSAFCGQRYFLLIIIHTEFSLLSFYIHILKITLKTWRYTI